MSWDPVAPASFGALPFIWARCTHRCWPPHRDPEFQSALRSFLSELSPAVLRQPLVFLTELLAAIPSIVYGLWGIFVLVRQSEGSSRRCLPRSGRCRSSAVRRSASGCYRRRSSSPSLVIPFVSSVAREVLQSVPLAQRERRNALAATRFEAISAPLF